jgi:hypothetical protein
MPRRRAAGIAAFLQWPGLPGAAPSDPPHRADSLSATQPYSGRAFERGVVAWVEGPAVVLDKRIALSQRRWIRLRFAGLNGMTGSRRKLLPFRVFAVNSW